MQSGSRGPLRFPGSRNARGQSFSVKNLRSATLPRSAQNPTLPNGPNPATRTSAPPRPRRPTAPRSPIKPSLTGPQPVTSPSLSPQLARASNPPSSVSSSPANGKSSNAGGGDDMNLPHVPQGAAPAVKSQKKLTKAERREKIAKEIVQTEQTFVESLEALKTLYIDPLNQAASSSKIVSTKYIEAIFSNIAVILPLNKKLHEDLRQIVDHWTEDSEVATIFKNFAPFFKMYTSYVNNHDSAVDTLKEQLENNAKFARFCEEAELNPLSKTAKLASFLILPIQRIPRYRLLLEEIQKNTPESHRNYKIQAEALELVKEVATTINEAVRAQANRAQIISIQEQFQGDITFVEPSRRFIHQGQLTKVCRASDRRYTFFLFSDLLVYASKGYRYKLHMKIPIGHLFHFDDLPNSAVENAFQISSQNKSFVVYAESAAEKSKWVKHLAKTCEEQRDKNKAGADDDQVVLAPVWAPDTSSNKCFVCKTSFSFVKRRHHCRRCGQLVCKDCSRTRAILVANDKNKVQRVCDDCITQSTNKVHITGPRNFRNTASTSSAASSTAGEDSDMDSDVSDFEGGGLDLTVRADYEYVAENDKELTIRPNDIIRVIHKDVSGWWTGELNGAKGIFPSTYCQEIKPKIDRSSSVPIINQQQNANPHQLFRSSTEEQNNSPAGQGVARRHVSPQSAARLHQQAQRNGLDSGSHTPVDVVVVHHEYTKSTPAELTLRVGEKILVKSRHDSGWWCGQNLATSEVGWFSPDFVSLPGGRPANAPLDQSGSFSIVNGHSMNGNNSNGRVSSAGGSRSGATSRQSTSGAGKCPDCSCTGFKPNTFRPNLCRECWHTENVHTG